MSRITAVLPFLPFTPGEKLVLAYEAYSSISKDLDPSSMSVLAGYTSTQTTSLLNEVLSGEGDVPREEGARGIQRAVQVRVEDELWWFIFSFSFSLFCSFLWVCDTGLSCRLLCVHWFRLDCGHTYILSCILFSHVLQEERRACSTLLMLPTPADKSANTVTRTLKVRISQKFWTTRCW